MSVVFVWCVVVRTVLSLRVARIGTTGVVTMWIVIFVLVSVWTTCSCAVGVGVCGLTRWVSMGLSAASDMLIKVRLCVVTVLTRLRLCRTARLCAMTSSGRP